MTSSYKTVVTPEQASKVLDWHKECGLTLWHSLNLSDPGTTWLTPSENGKPHWAAGNPEAVGLDDVGVGVYELFKRLHVAVRRGSQGLTTKLTDASSRRLRKALEDAGEGSTYHFDYFAQDALVYKRVSVVSLAEYQGQLPE